MAPVNEPSDHTEAEPVRMFGDPLSAFVQRGPDRRASSEDINVEALRREIDLHLTAAHRKAGPGRAARLGHGDGYAMALNILALIVFVVTIVAGTVILYNAKDVGAFANPWDSSRVAIGLVVLGVGIVHSAILLGVARAITYQLAALRLKMRELDVATLNAASSKNTAPATTGTGQTGTVSTAQIGTVSDPS